MALTSQYLSQRKLSNCDDEHDNSQTVKPSKSEKLNNKTLCDTS